ncbi:hypothetical protein EHP00_2160 [Ecytonucleospora hepatopenaei]|uniref:cysteine--tRNA ligase n=1 Tax=Ecytonucleospora hepatopenaei TaxID=646526 RepID=A0A1W0E566_9MICR|nr:hypothetical protein EHP00_2160 [Ecytonucleospora hepatopenaei]
MNTNNSNNTNITNNTNNTNNSNDNNIYVYNSLTKNKDIFKPIDPNNVNIYICGPTVYDSPHIGHARTYISFDVVRRVLEDYFGYGINMTMNITNIDDKIIKRAAETGTSWVDLSRKYEKEFLDQMEVLSVKRANFITRVDQYVPQVVKYIEELVSGSLAYESNGSVYFDLEEYKKYKKYNLLRPETQKNSIILEGEDTTNSNNSNNNSNTDNSNNNINNNNINNSSNNNINNNNNNNTNNNNIVKKNDGDFVLWKASKHNEISYDSPWGKGRPGWHIECSAMAHSIYGEKLDIHGGGVDLSFPHHENEIAQSQGLHMCVTNSNILYNDNIIYNDNNNIKDSDNNITNKLYNTNITNNINDNINNSNITNNSNTWCNTFWHTGHLNIDGRKMSKSLKNFLTITDILNVYSPVTLRILFIQHTWNAPMNYDEEQLKRAEVTRKKIYNFISTAEGYIIKQYNSYNITNITDSDNSNILNNNTDILNSNVLYDTTKYNQSMSHTDHIVFDSYMSTKNDVDLYLRNNINYTDAFNSIINLIKLTNTHMDVLCTDMIYTILTYVKRMMNILGITLNSNSNILNNNSNMLNNNILNNNDSIVIHAFNEFRNTIRMLTKNKSDSKAYYDACDNIRKEVEKYGYKIEDKKGESTIKRNNL